MLFMKENKWLPIPRISRTIPFGYAVDKDDPNLLQPVPFELEAFEQAKKHLKQFSLRDTAQWLSQVTGRQITYEGLRKRLRIEQSRRRTTQALKIWTKRVAAAEEKIARYEAQSLGSRTSETSGGGSSEVAV